MVYENTKLRNLWLVFVSLFACGALGCGKSPETIDENQLAQHRQWMEIEKAIETAKLPVPVPNGAEEILAGHFGSISEMAISSGRTKLLVMGTDPTDTSDLPRSSAFVVDLKQAKVLSKYDLHLYRSAFSPDERKLAAIGHVASPVESTPSTTAEHRSRTRLEQLANGQGSWKWTYDVRVADVATGQWQVVVGQSPEAIQAIGWSQDGQEVITVKKTRHVQSEAEFAEAQKQDPNLLVDLVGEPQIEFSFWNGETGEPLKTVNGPKLNYDSALLSGDGRVVALWNSTGTNDIVICSPTSGRELFRLDAANRPVQDLAISPSGRYLACRGKNETDSDTSIVIWDTESGKRQCEFKCKAARMAFRPDGQQMATANAAIDENGELAWDASLWDVNQGVEQRKLKPGGKNIRVAFLNHGELLTSSTFGNNHVLHSQIFVWNIANK